MLQTLQTRFYTDWNFYRRVLAITLPIAIQNVINLGVNMMDIIMLGQLGDTAIAAANPAIPKSMIFRISIPPSNVFRGFSDKPEHFPFSTFI